MKNYHIYLIGILSLLIISCQPEIEETFQPSNGKADFSTYVSIGNSLTAGYADGALYHSSQAQSWPSILAQQLKEVGGGDFIQPVVESEQGVLSGKLSLQLINGSLLPAPAEDGELDPFYPPLEYRVHNLGVPGAKVVHLLLPGYGNIQNIASLTANPYFVRFAKNSEITVIDQALEMSPTFFSLWIGNNDVLGFASSGGAFDLITPLADFQNQYAALAQKLNASGAKGVLANIPSVTAAPYFTTVPINALEIDAATASQLNLGITLVESQINSVLSAAGLPAFSYNIEFKAGKNNFLIQDNNFLYKDILNAIADTTSDPFNKMLLKRVQFRQATDVELLTLQTPQDSLAMGMGSFMVMEGSPLPLPYGIPNQFVVDELELGQISTAIYEFNQVIKNTAEAYGWAYVDVYETFNDIKASGYEEDGISMTTDFVTGGVFSLDGVHLTPRGYAMVSNFFIDAINEHYGSSISKVYLSQYAAVKYP
jgi:lysophospholipase L1-like esterase